MGRTRKNDGRLCGAKRVKGKGPCKNPAGWQTDHPGWGKCVFHNGEAPTVALSAAKEQAQHQMVSMGREVDIAPHEAILMCIRITAGEVGFATERIHELEMDQLMVSDEQVLDRPLNEGKEGENPGVEVHERRRGSDTKIHAWVRVRADAMNRLVQYSTAAIKSGFEERLVQVAEAQGELLATAVRGILSDLGVIDHPQAPAVVRKHLLQLTQKTG